MYRGNNSPVRCIIPPHMFEEIAKRGAEHQKEWALHNLSLSGFIRGQRQAVAAFPTAAAAGHKYRTVSDCKHGGANPPTGTLVRKEGQKASKDKAVNEAYDGAGATYDLYFDVYQRNSIDDKGMTIASFVHYDTHYNNAFWDGSEMVYGDGDGEIFDRFTKCIDVIGHELTHGVTQYEANLAYSGQPGALNESLSDVFGSLVKQRSLDQTADKADWLIGAGLFTKKVKGVALRSMKAPGTAYDDPVLGKDPQPGHMKDYVNTSSDNGGVHTNSGIPNHAFFLAATAIGGRAWEKAGKIWYVALRDRLRSTATFKQAASATISVAKDLFGDGSKEMKAVQAAWKGVGVI
ncbi:MAG TPA: M4 family metallopeptidase [Geobacteraceae bacterium]